MLLTRLAALAALASIGLTLTAAGCGGGGGPGSVSGSVHGATLGVNDTASGIYSDVTGTLAVVVLTTEPAVCATFTSGASVKDTTSLLVTMSQIDIKTLKTVAATAPGTFTVYGKALPATSDVATVSWLQNDANCTSTTVASGASGTISLTAVDNGAYSGTGDVTFDSGDHVTFSFTGTACAAITTAQSMTATSCM